MSIDTSFQGAKWHSTNLNLDDDEVFNLAQKNNISIQLSKLLVNRKIKTISKWIVSKNSILRIMPNILISSNNSSTAVYAKNLNDDQKQKYSELFKEYFLKSFSSRLAEYTNPEIEVQGKEVLNKNYTIVNSLLVGTSDRPEVKIDWRVYTKNPDNPLIRDLIIEGLSLARTQKEEFASILNSNDNNIDALFKSLEEFSKN